MSKKLFIISALFMLFSALHAAEVKESSMTVINRILASTGSAVSVNLEELQALQQSQQEMPEASADSTKPLPEKVKIYVNKLGSTSPITEQTFAKNQLIKMGKEALPYLEEHLKNDKRTWNKAQIAFVLGKIGDPSAIPALEEASKSEYAALKSASVRAIGEIGGTEAEKALERIKTENTSDKTLTETIDQALINAKNKMQKE